MNQFFGGPSFVKTAVAFWKDCDNPYQEVCALSEDGRAYVWRHPSYEVTWSPLDSPACLTLRDIAAVSWRYGENILTNNPGYGYFAVDDGGMIYQQSPVFRSSAWSGWVPESEFAKETTSKLALATPGTISAVSWDRDHLGLYVIGYRDRSLWQKRWTGKWDKQWESSGHPTNVKLTAIAAVWLEPGSYGVYALGNDGNLYEKWLAPKEHDWTNCQRPAGVKELTALSALHVRNGTYGIYAIANDGCLYELYWKGEWTQWTSLGKPGQTQLVAVAANQYDQGPWPEEAFYSVLAVGKDGTIYTREYAGTTWTDWAPVIPEVDYARWQSGIPNETRINQFTIPGTHDSATYTAVVPPVKTQHHDIYEQLRHGIRFLDARCVQWEGALYMYHGGLPLKLKFDEFLDPCVKFLMENPSECLIISVSNEFNKDEFPKNFHKSNQKSFHQTFYDEYYANEKYHRFWFGENRFPAMEEVRGMMVLMWGATWINSQDGLPNEPQYGIDYSVNRPSSSCTTAYHSAVHAFYLQNQWKSMETEKWNRVESTLKIAREDLHGKWKDLMYLNYTSANCVENLTRDLSDKFPYPIAQDINMRLIEYLRKPENWRGQYGIVIMDYPEYSPDWRAVKLLVASNAALP